MRPIFCRGLLPLDPRRNGLAKTLLQRIAIFVPIAFSLSMRSFRRSDADDSNERRSRFCSGEISSSRRFRVPFDVRKVDAVFGSVRIVDRNHPAPVLPRLPPLCNDDPGFVSRHVRDAKIAQPGAVLRNQHLFGLFHATCYSNTSVPKFFMSWKLAPTRDQSQPVVFPSS